MSRLASSMGIVLTCCVVTFHNCRTYVPGHRIFYDEDVYANMSKNLDGGFGGGVTVLWLPDAKRVERCKWPVGFPAAALPWIRMFGAERGPSLLNGLCGILTSALIGFLVFRWTGDRPAAIMAILLFALNPIAAMWYRSGAADPSAVLLALASLAAADLSKGRPGWVVTALLLALVAVNFRLDNVLLVLPLSLWLGPRPLTLPKSHLAVLLALAVVPIAALASQSSVFYLHYLSSRSDSSFSFSSILPNIVTDFHFFLESGVLPFTSAGFIALVWLTWLEARWLGLLAWLVAQTALLSVYSVGQFSAPGGSRFFLIPSIVLTLSLAVALARIQPRYRLWAQAIGFLALCLLFLGHEKAWQRWDDLNSAPRAEHDAILHWAKTLSPGSVVMSETPYLWENAGVFTAPHTPEIPARTTGPLYWHRSLFDQKEPLPPEAAVVGNLRTQHGDVFLIRIR
jgi:hypothetical protein